MIAKAIMVMALLCTALGQETDARVNLALGKPATQSSTYTQSLGAAVASRAVDGNTNTLWTAQSCTATTGEFAPWLRIDFEHELTLDTVKLWNRGDCCAHGLQDVSIYFGNDASAFGNNTACATDVDVPQTNAGFELPCAGTGRYLWVALPTVTRTLTICELQAFGPNTPAPPPTPAPPTSPAPPLPAALANLALGKPATQSSTYTHSLGAAVASRAVDGNTNTLWTAESCTATNSEFAPWLRIDFEVEVTLNSVKLWNRGDCCAHGLQDVSIYIGNDASAFGNNTACATDVDVPQTYAGFDVPCFGSGRYLWVALPTVMRTLTICELQAFGPTQAPTPAPTLPEPERCIGACLWSVCSTEGSLITVRVRGLLSSSVPCFGSSHYSDDSDVGLAAVHAGILSVDEVKDVTVVCSGSQSSFTGTTKNGVTTQSYGSPYNSFYFAGDISVGAPPTSPPAPFICYHPRCLRNMCLTAGQKFDVRVTGSWWTLGSFAIGDSDGYSDFSTVAMVAVHAGVLQRGETKTLRVNCKGTLDSFPGTLENGVQSRFHPFPARAFTFEPVVLSPAPTPSPDTCAACLDGLCSVAGITHEITVIGSNESVAWGTNVYSDDSHIGVAAVHAGLVTVGETKTITVTCQGPASSFTGTTRNAVTTESYGPWNGTFSLVPLTPAPPAPCSGRCMHNECAVTGTTKNLIVVGSTTGDVWGTDKYSDDSDIQVAAVHMGLVGIGATATIRVQCTGPDDTWLGTTRNGATTLDYPTLWNFSYTLSAP